MGEALGMIETRGLVAMIEAADAMVKAAKVKITVEVPNVFRCPAPVLIHNHQSEGRHSPNIMSPTFGLDCLNRKAGREPCKPKPPRKLKQSSTCAPLAKCETAS